MRFDTRGKSGIVRAGPALAKNPRRLSVRLSLYDMVCHADRNK